METLNNFISQINALAWGPPMLIILGGTGLFLTAGLAFMPWRKIGFATILTFGRTRNKAKGDVKPFNALMTALSATVGTGNIAGVATAITLGGPGAIFYMWVIALFGMATKYAEAVCAVKYRETDSTGKFIGGPMYYLKNGVGGKLGSVLGIIFAVFGAVAAFGVGNGIQINSMAAVVNSSFGVPPIYTGIIVAALIAFVIIGGIKRISEIAGKLIPIMIVLYISAGLAVILVNLQQVPDAFALILKHAFTPAAATGGFAGAAVAAAIRFGVARGVFSNEAGLGSAAIAHAPAKTEEPVEQGMIAMLGVFIDTIIVCTITALCILTTGAWTSGETGATLTSQAFAQTFLGGNYVVAIALVVFAFTTIIGWSYYGERCWQYLFKAKSIVVYRVIWVIAIVWFSIQKVDFVWNLSDTFAGLMALPNLVGLIMLSPIIFKLTKEYFNRSKEV
ncbi:MAG: alanine/glycine:cation symporter family protein [Arenicella sp.]